MPWITSTRTLGVDMTCNRYSRSRKRTARFLLVVVSSFIITSCRSKTVEVIGIERDASTGCVPMERVFQFEVEDGDIPTDVPPEWCAIMDESPHIVCFMHAQMVIRDMASSCQEPCLTRTFQEAIPISNAGPPNESSGTPRGTARASPIIRSGRTTGAVELGTI
jgi:hypothetical protein